ncbi:uncharacterized protein An07g07770 [Aspergillus niger]|uniref:Contig An07c0220, genomic contig n=2 Tax=Aspergillus niger TaxID=5061 RepID=A5AAX8_ASPNC|nr:uncharacterized protein An07g07770 [Aspergillus niger]CAK39593.1 unnamed protein product [Aspergillus niger]
MRAVEERRKYTSSFPAIMTPNHLANSPKTRMHCDDRGEGLVIAGGDSAGSSTQLAVNCLPALRPRAQSRRAVMEGGKGTRRIPPHTFSISPARLDHSARVAMSGIKSWTCRASSRQHPANLRSGSRPEKEGKAADDEEGGDGHWVCLERRVEWRNKIGGGKIWAGGGGKGSVDVDVVDVDGKGKGGDTDKREIGNWELGIDGLPGRGWDSSRKETD